MTSSHLVMGWVECPVWVYDSDFAGDDDSFCAS